MGGAASGGQSSALGGASSGGANLGGANSAGANSAGATAGGASAGGQVGSGGANSGGANSGGVSGSGTAGSAGNAGASLGGAATGGSAAGGASAAPCDIGGKILCDDFESEASGALPTGTPWAPLNCFASGYTLGVSAAAHHSGMHSFLGQGIPYADCQLHADLGTSLKEYWVRAWVYYGGTAPTSSTHEVSVFELVPSASTDDPSIRVGYRGDTCSPIGVEVNITGGGQEETGCTGATPVANKWYCYVLHVTQAASSVSADLSIDGVDQSYTNHGQSQTVITSQVANIRYLRLGPRSYSGAFANPIYVDDVAVATQALNCNP
jgi:hypothetical protein